MNEFTKAFQKFNKNMAPDKEELDEMDKDG
jgi:hypothetical protein